MKQKNYLKETKEARLILNLNFFINPTLMVINFFREFLIHFTIFIQEYLNLTNLKGCFLENFL